MHYLIAVFTTDDQTVDELMEPFYEELEVEPYVSETREDFLTSQRDLFNECINSPNVDEEKRKYYEGLMKLSDDDLINHFRETEEYLFDENGNRLSTYNPNAKYDYYSEGGRWGGSLTLRPLSDSDTDTEDYDAYDDPKAKGNTTDSAKVRHVYLEFDPYHYEKTLGECQENPTLRAYALEECGSIEAYAKRQSEVMPYGFLTPDGVWHDKDDCYRVTDGGEARRLIEEYENSFREFVKDKDNQELTITMVDVHM